MISSHDDPRLEDPELAFATRELCLDGSCIGLIGPNGSCKECGRIGESQTRDRRLRGLSPNASGEMQRPQHAELDAAEGTTSVEESEPLDFANRTLCSDGACLGVLGPTNRCNECGR